MKKNQYIAPVVIAVLFIGYCIFYGYVISLSEIPKIVKIIFTVIPICMIISMIFVLIERIKEIRKGENDDISKY